MSCSIINHMTGIEDLSYLELGVFKNKNFNEIKASKKYSVDVNGNGMFVGTTDEFFSQLDKTTKFDIIFIDANHDYDFVLNDYNNSVDYATKWILIHDMFPPSVKYTESKFCSDSYKLLYYMIKETNLSVYTMDNNFGLTLIKMPGKKINPPDSYKNVSYDEFLSFMKTQKLYSDNEVVKILNS